MEALRTLLESLTSFEAASLLAYYLQLTLIGGGLLMVHWAGRRRDRQLAVILKQAEAQTRALEATIERMEEQSRSQAEFNRTLAEDLSRSLAEFNRALLEEQSRALTEFNRSLLAEQSRSLAELPRSVVEDQSRAQTALPRPVADEQSRTLAEVTRSLAEQNRALEEVLRRVA